LFDIVIADGDLNNGELSIECYNAERACVCGYSLSGLDQSAPI